MSEGMDYSFTYDGKTFRFEKDCDVEEMVRIVNAIKSALHRPASGAEGTSRGQAGAIRDILRESPGLRWEAISERLRELGFQPSTAAIQSLVQRGILRREGATKRYKYFLADTGEADNYSTEEDEADAEA